MSRQVTREDQVEQPPLPLLPEAEWMTMTGEQTDVEECTLWPAIAFQVRVPWGHRHRWTHTLSHTLVDTHMHARAHGHTLLKSLALSFVEQGCPSEPAVTVCQSFTVLHETLIACMYRSSSPLAQRPPSPIVPWVWKYAWRYEHSTSHCWRVSYDTVIFCWL
jgi:hypothetical protein